MRELRRQGDVLIVTTNETIPADAKPEPAEAGRTILAHGEATGHAHAVLERDAVIRSRTTGMTVERWLDAHSATPLVHEEHAPFEVPQGTGPIIGQREYHPEAIRNVVD